MLRSFRAHDARYPKLMQIALGLIISLSISASLSLHVRADVTAAMGAKEDRASTVFVGSVQTVKTGTCEMGPMLRLRVALLCGAESDRFRIGDTAPQYREWLGHCRVG